MENVKDKTVLNVCISTIVGILIGMVIGILIGYTLCVLIGRHNKITIPNMSTIIKDVAITHPACF